MNQVRVWHPDFRFYEELVGVRCVSKDDLDKLLAACCGRDLRACPRYTVVQTLVVPREATPFLPLDTAKHCIISLRETMYLSDAVNQELNRRFLAKDPDQPHYYTTGRGSQRTCCRRLVALAVVKAIETSLA